MSNVIQLQLERAIKAENDKLSLKLVKDALRIASNDPYFWTVLAKLQLKQRQFLQAKQSVANALKINNSYAWAHSMSGCIWAKQKHHKEALEAFEFAISLEPENMEVLYDYAQYLEETRIDLEKAERFVRRRMILQPDQAVDYELQGRILLAANELVEAEQAFKTALKLDPLFEKSYIGLARLEMFHKRNAFAAVEILRRGLLLHPYSHFLRHYFNEALNSKNSFYGSMWGAGLFYATSVKWNWFLLLTLFVVPPLLLYFRSLDDQVASLTNIFLVIHLCYCLYCWSSGFLMRLLLERGWLS